MAIALAIKVPVGEIKMSKAAASVATVAMKRHVYPSAMPAKSPMERVAAEFDRIGMSVTCRKGQMLVREGDPAEHVFKVTSGALTAVRLLLNGRRHIGNFLMPGDFFGLADEESYGHSIEAIADAGLVRYRRSSFKSLLDRDPRTGHRFFGVMCKELSAAQDRLLLLGRKTAVERLASFLLDLADRKVCNGGAGQRQIELPMDRSDIGDYLGVRFETISRLLTHLKSRRIIDLPNSHSVALLRQDILREISEGNA